MWRICMEKVLKIAMAPFQKLHAYNKGIIFMIHLSKVWHEYQMWNKSDTLLLDDSPERYHCIINLPIHILNHSLRRTRSWLIYWFMICFSTTPASSFLVHYFQIYSFIPDWKQDSTLDRNLARILSICPFFSRLAWITSLCKNLSACLLSLLLIRLMPCSPDRKQWEISKRMSFRFLSRCPFLS